MSNLNYPGIAVWEAQVAAAESKLAAIKGSLDANDWSFGLKLLLGVCRREQQAKIDAQRVTLDDADADLEKAWQVYMTDQVPAHGYGDALIQMGQQVNDQRSLLDWQEALLDVLKDFPFS